LTLTEPSFPPLLEGRAVINGDNPRALAVGGASVGTLGAGDTLWLQDTTRVELAIVLEPDDPLSKAAQMLPLAVAAAGDCLGTMLPPQVGVQFRWPGKLLLNGAEVGECTLTAPANCKASEVPEWLVVNLSLRFAFDESYEPGTTPGITSLVEEGIEELTTADVIESYSRHFLSLLDTWTNDGFADVCENWGGRAEGVSEPAIIHHPDGSLKARVLALDEDGNLIVRPEANDQTNDQSRDQSRIQSIALPLLACISHAGTDTPPASTSSAR
jgi:biotin-(acetyl-CoA carboxylase) ligase